MPKRIFSGVQPTANLHLGNYLGAIRQWVDLQREYESFFCVVNLHAVTVPQDPLKLATQTQSVARIYLAAGIDPQYSSIFVQSDLPEHAELAWLLNCITRISELERMTQFKEKARRVREQSGVTNVSAGLLNYPVLMASDILLYQTDLVPVGHDQKQHLELTRDLAERFNRDFGETFRMPEPFIPKVGARIMALDDPSKKMSKSEENDASRIGLLDDADTIRRKYKRAVTDSGSEIRFDPERPAINNLLTIYQLLTNKSPAEVEENFAGKGYAQLKGELADVTIEFLSPFQERVRNISDAELRGVLEQGRERAQAIARATLAEVKGRMGLKGASEL